MPDKSQTMPKPEREKAILEFLESREVMLPPRVLYENMVEFESITFSFRSVVRYLDDLQERGLVERPREEKPYYRITDAGRAYLAGEE